MTARILKASGDIFRCQSEGDVFRCRARGNLRLGGISPCAGDFVTVEDNHITAILPRKNLLPRPSAANVDLLLAVVSTCEPKPNTAVLDTITVIAQLSGIDCAIAFTKCDLASAEPWLSIYKKAGFKCFCANPNDPNDDLRALEREIQGKTVIFAGNTGAGKSTLLNRILPELGLATGEISKKLGRGRHTTRQTEFFPVGDMLLGDSPGFSALELSAQNIDPKELAGGFREFLPYQGQCKFQDCRHLKEPQCAVRAAAEKGEIPLPRYKNYVFFYEECKRAVEW